MKNKSSLAIYRVKAGYTLQEVAEAIGRSVSYLSEIENGKKNPSDELLRKIAELYKIPEQVLFEKFGRIPLGVKEEIEKSDALKQILLEFRYNPLLADEEDKKEVAGKLLAYFRRLVED